MGAGGGVGVGLGDGVGVGVPPLLPPHAAMATKIETDKAVEMMRKIHPFLLNLRYDFRN